ncbi:hypothetical protein [Paenibacillus polymyxa]|uniref:hypothetical protein n=1 Tax=Paenibacillus polymyxa TaxID=1406 RepID=UPI0004DF4F22|nr:hypothetical protein [Paenibacillus polymyxa]RPE03348.1 hypothetical protein EG487_14285 [Paenibacillus polymyxa]
MDDQATESLLDRFSFWSRYLGFMLIVGGVLILAFLIFISLAIPYLSLIGILPIVIGVMLFKAGNRARDFLITEDEASFNSMIMYLLNYIKWQVFFWLGVSAVAGFFGMLIYIFKDYKN